MLNLSFCCLDKYARTIYYLVILLLVNRSAHFTAHSAAHRIAISQSLPFFDAQCNGSAQQQ